jgi:transposase-like protein
MPSKKLTAEIFGLIPALVEQGKSKAEIAETYGVKVSTLQVQCCRQGVSLRKGGPRPPRVTLSLPTPLTLTSRTLSALSTAAKARGKDEA